MAKHNKGPDTSVARNDKASRRNQVNRGPGTSPEWGRHASQEKYSRQVEYLKDLETRPSEAVKAFEKVRQALKSRDRNVRQAAASVLGQVVERLSRSVLQEIRKELEKGVERETPGEVRRTFRAALYLVKEELENNHTNRRRQHEAEASASIDSLRPAERAEYLLNQLGNPELTMRRVAAKRLMELPAISGCIRNKVVLQLLGETDAIIQERLARALLRARGKEDGPFPRQAKQFFCCMRRRQTAKQVRRAVALAACHLHNLDDGDAAICIKKVLKADPGFTREISAALERVVAPGPKMQALMHEMQVRRQR